MLNVSSWITKCYYTIGMLSINVIGFTISKFGGFIGYGYYVDAVDAV
jgi:hypothetical protein